MSIIMHEVLEFIENERFRNLLQDIISNVVDRGIDFVVDRIDEKLKEWEVSRGKREVLVYALKIPKPVLFNCCFFEYTIPEATLYYLIKKLLPIAIKKLWNIFERNFIESERFQNLVQDIISNVVDRGIDFVVDRIDEKLKEWEVPRGKREVLVYALRIALHVLFYCCFFEYTIPEATLYYLIKKLLPIVIKKLWNIFERNFIESERFRNLVQDIISNVVDRGIDFVVDRIDEKLKEWEVPRGKREVLVYALRIALHILFYCCFFEYSMPECYAILSHQKVATNCN